MISFDGQKHLTSELLVHAPACCIQVLKHLGRTGGQGASGTGVFGGGGLTAVLEELVVIVLGTHLPSLSCSESLHEGAGVVLAELVDAVFGTQLPSLSSSVSLQPGTGTVVV